MYRLNSFQSYRTEKWAATWQNQQNECAPSEDSDQPGHPPSLIWVFAVRMKTAWVLSYPLSAKRGLWSDWADTQADLSLPWAHSHFVVLSYCGSNDLQTKEQDRRLCYIEPHYEKTCLRGFRSGETWTGLLSHRDKLESCNFGYSK